MVKSMKVNRGIRIKLYLESMLPLFFFEGLLQLKYQTFQLFTSEPFLRALKLFIRRNSFALIFLILGGITLYFLLHGLDFSQYEQVERKEDADLSSKRFSIWLFCLTYVLPIIFIWRFGFKGKLLTLLIIFIVGVFSLYTSLYYRNPVLWLFGYRVYIHKGPEGNGVEIVDGRIRINNRIEIKAIEINSKEFFLSNPVRNWRVKAFFAFFTKKGKHIAHFVIKHPAFTAVIYSTTIMFVMWAADLMRWEGADDFTMSQLMMGSSGERTPFVLTISYYLGTFIVWLQTVAPVINWFTALEILSVWISFTIMEWFVLKHMDSRKLIIALLFLIVAEPLYFLSLQYTRSAFILSLAGLLVIYDATIKDLFPHNVKKSGLVSSDMKGNTDPDDATFSLAKADGHRGYFLLNVLKAICGVLLFIIGTLFRFACFYAAIAFVGILLFGFVLDTVRNKCFKSNVVRIIWFVAIALIAVSGATWIYGSNIKIYSQWGKTNDYKEFNKIRAEVIDYIPSEYSKVFSTDSLEISYNDWYMLKCYVINDDYFSYEYFKKVLNNLDSVRNEDSSAAEYNLKQIMWYRSGRVSGKRTQLIVCILIGFAALLMSGGNRKKRLCILIDIVGTIILLWYFLAGDRLPPWVSDPVYLFSMYIALVYMCCDLDLSEEEKHSDVVKSYVAEVIILFCLFINVYNVYDFAKQNYFNVELKEAIQYAEKADGVFLLDNISDAPYPFIDIYDATYCFKKGQWDNIIRVGNWDVDHPERNRQKEALGIKSVLYSMVQGKSKLISKEGSSSFEMYETFFKEHYDVDVYFVCVKEYGEYGIYKCLIRQP